MSAEAIEESAPAEAIEESVPFPENAESKSADMTTEPAPALSQQSEN